MCPEAFRSSDGGARARRKRGSEELGERGKAVPKRRAAPSYRLLVPLATTEADYARLYESMMKVIMDMSDRRFAELMAAADPTSGSGLLR